jgi:hypothetical protein
MRLLIGFALSAVGWGCSCAVSPLGAPACQTAWTHAAVFTGMVTEIVEPDRSFAIAPPADFPQRKVRFAVSEALTGLPPSTKEITVETGLGGGDCGYGFRRGVDYIVYASRNANGAYYTGICSPTRRVPDAAEDLKYFHQLADASPLGEIRAMAFDPQRSRGVLELLGAQLTIDGPGGRQFGVTRADGRYTFDALAPGEYTLSASLENYTVAGQLRPLKVPAKGCALVIVPLMLDRNVSGRILTPDGRPASGVMVEAVPTRPRYENDLPMAADSFTTDADGRYRLRNLSTGDYYLGISLSRSPTKACPYTRWFYPGTENPALAGIVHVSDRPGSQSFDLTLPAIQHERAIEGTVFRADGRPAEKVSIFLEDPRWPWQTSTVAAATDSQGHFRAYGLDGTRYRLHAAIFATPKNPISAEPAPIEPGGEAVNLKLILTRKGYSPMDLVRTGLDNWRKGLGLQ